MVEPEEIRPKLGRPESRVDTELVKLANVDLTTIRILNALIEYGRFGTTRQEIIMFILRSWFWENEAHLRELLGPTENPFTHSFEKPNKS